MLSKEAPLFITFEGGEGAGKSTQIKHLSTYLTELSIPHLLTREPGGTVLAEKIRTLLVTGKADAMDPLTEYLLFSAARRDHLEKVIKPALSQGSWVLCDRFYDSSYVYQGLSPKPDRALNLPFMDRVYKEIAGPRFEPDLTFVFDIDPKIGLARVQKRSDLSDDKRTVQENRFESKGLDFHNRIRQGFLKLQANNTHRCCLIDATQSPEQTFYYIRSILEEF
jgi:dTMP kinase